MSKSIRKTQICVFFRKTQKKAKAYAFENLPALAVPSLLFFWHCYAMTTWLLVIERCAQHSPREYERVGVRRRRQAALLSSSRERGGAPLEKDEAL